MKKNVEEILIQLTDLGQNSNKKPLFYNSIEQMGLEEVLTWTRFLKQWQKSIAKKTCKYADDFFENEFLIDVQVPSYTSLFFHCPALKEVFALQEDRITYNLNLSQEEIDEIVAYIDENFKLVKRIGRYGKPRKLPGNE